MSAREKNRLPSNLIEAWIAAETATPGRTLADAVRDLADEMGRPIRQSRVYEWRDAKRTPSPDVLRYMARVAALSILSPYGIDDDAALDAIADAFTPPDRM